eukprot:ANDGO_06283.mRNA.1 Uncharacterized protein At4g15545
MNSAMDVPKNADEQFAYGLRILQRAFSLKTESMDADMSKFKSMFSEQKAVVSSLEDRIRSLEEDLSLSNAKNKQLISEKSALIQENENLHAALKKTQRDAAQLNQFRSVIISSLHETDVADAAFANPSSGRGAALGNSSATFGLHYSPESLVSLSATTNPSPPTMHAGSSHHGGGLGSGGASTGDYSGMGASAHGSNAFGSGGGAVDGKEFFRLARSRLDYAAFQEFLGLIKKLNNRSSTKAETLGHARSIFLGAGHEDLFFQFEKLLENHRD